MENLNIHARVTGVAWRKMIEDELPEKALWRMSVRDYDNDNEWLEEVRAVTRREEDFKERTGLRGGGPSSAKIGEKRKAEDSRPAAPEKKARKQYSAKEKAEYKKKKAVERKVKKEGSVAPKGEVKFTVWATAHPGVEQDIVDQRKKNNECTRCGMDNHTWKYCRKPVKISAIHRGPIKPKRQQSFAPKRCPQVATVADRGQGGSSSRAIRRPPAWSFENDDEIL